MDGNGMELQGAFANTGDNRLIQVLSGSKRVFYKIRPPTPGGDII